MVITCIMMAKNGNSDSGIYGHAYDDGTSDVADSRDDDNYDDDFDSDDGFDDRGNKYNKDYMIR